MQELTPPQNFQPAGDVLINPPATAPYPVDGSPVQNSTNPVSSGGVWEALDGKEPAITPPSTNPEEYVFTGEKNWRNLLEWVGQLLEQAVENLGGSVNWTDIIGRPDVVIDEADPTVPTWVKNITEEEKDFLVWLSENLTTEQMQDFYGNKGVIDEPVDFSDFLKNGSYRVSLENWDGCQHFPYKCIPQGHLQRFVGGATRMMLYTDDNGMSAEWYTKEAEEITEQNWQFPINAQLQEFDDQGRQLLITADIKRGKIMEVFQRAIFKGVEHRGILAPDTVLTAIPDNPGNMEVYNGFSFWTIQDWAAFVDGPQNLSGEGFLLVKHFNGFAHLQAYDFDFKTAFAVRRNLETPLSAWQIETVDYYNRSTIDYMLGFYSQVGHNHDERYYLKSEITQLLENYLLSTWKPSIDDVESLGLTLANKIDISLFLNGIIGGALIVGEDKQPTIVDLDDPYINASILVNAKVGQDYGQSVAAEGIFDAYTGYKIDESQIVWPRGALNKKLIPVSAQGWIGFEFHQSNGDIGSSYDGQGFIIKGNSAPTVSGETTILVDMIHTTTPNGRPRREQRALLIRVDPADVVITAPSTPTPAAATAVSTTQINVSWADVAGEAGYEIWSSNAPAGYYTRIGSTGPNQTSFQHTGLEPNTAYYYKINAYNSAGSSGFADANATTLAGAAPVTGGLYARYYPSTTLDSTTSVNRVDQVIDFNLVNTDPIAGVAYGAFSVRWSGKIKSPVSGNIGFQFNSNAGVRVWIGGQPVVDNWVDRTVLQANQFSVSMVANTDYDIIIEYYQINNTTRAHLQYRNGATYDIVPTTWLTPVALLGAPIPAPVLTASPEGSDTVNLSWVYGGSADYFEVSGGTSNTTFPVLNNHVPLGAAREEIIGGLPSSTTFYFRIRAYTGGRYSPYSNIATAATAAPEQLPNAPAPVSLTRIVPGDLSGSNLEVRFTDTNVGSEQYEIRFREYGTTQWFTLVAGFQLSPNAANPLLLSYNTLNIVQSISNNTFQGKRMEVAVRVVKSATLKSAWVSAVEAPADSGSGGDPVDPNAEVQIIDYEDFVVVRNQDGTYSDTKPRTVGDEFHAFYLCEDDYDIDFYNQDGSPKAFENITLDADSVYVFRKLMLRKSVYPTLQSWKENAWWSNIGQQESNMLYSAQAVVRTYGTPSQEVVVGAPNPIIVTRVGTSDIDITILIAGRTQGRSYEINYRVVGTSTWYVFASDFSLKPFPATANLVQEPVDATTNIVLILEDRELFTQGRIEVRARAYENGNVSAWSSIYAEPANSDKLDLSLLLLDWGGNWGNDEIMWSDNSYHNGYWYASPASTVPTGLTVSSWPKIQGAANYASSKKLKSIVMPVFWDRCNPAEGVYIFQQIRFAVLYIASKGLKTHFFVDATRRWTADPAFRTTSDWTFSLEDAEIDEHGNLHGEPFNHIPALGSDKWNNWFIFVRALAEALADLSEHIGWYAGSSNPTKEWGTLFNENSTSHPDTIAMYQAWHNVRYGNTPSAIAKVSDPNSTNKQRTGKFHSLRMIELWESATEEIKAANPDFKTVYHMSSATNQTFKRTCLTVPANLPSVIDGMKSNPARAFDPSFAIRAVARPGKLAIVEYAYDEVEYAGVHPGVAGYEIANKVKIAFDNGATGAVLAFFENAYANIGGPADVCLTALVESLESAGYLDTTYYYYTGNPDIINMSAVVAMANNNGDYEQAYLAQFNASKDARFQQLPAINYVDDI
ncbi:PA14 domain-containing protein [Runella zeae]|uniref:PA14 domain-containing protein n=1 Tax=Runella zeae TaxID=94255 RepID=UPI00235746E0|nr:PA14 domain-containing protein [Runella zeae]